MRRRQPRIFRAWCENLEDRSLLSLLTPFQVRQAYGMNAVEFNAERENDRGEQGPARPSPLSELTTTRS